MYVILSAISLISTHFLKGVTHVSSLKFVRGFFSGLKISLYCRLKYSSG